MAKVFGVGGHLRGVCLLPPFVKSTFPPSRILNQIIYDVRNDSNKPTQNVKWWLSSAKCNPFIISGFFGHSYKNSSHVNWKLKILPTRTIRIFCKQCESQNDSILRTCQKLRYFKQVSKSPCDHGILTYKTTHVMFLFLGWRPGHWSVTSFFTPSHSFCWWHSSLTTRSNGGKHWYSSYGKCHHYYSNTLLCCECPF